MLVFGGCNHHHPFTPQIRPAISLQKPRGIFWEVFSPQKLPRQCAQDALAFSVTHGGQNSFMETWREWWWETTPKLNRWNPRLECLVGKFGYQWLGTGTGWFQPYAPWRINMDRQNSRLDNFWGFTMLIFRVSRGFLQFVDFLKRRVPNKGGKWGLAGNLHQP